MGTAHFGFSLTFSGPQDRQTYMALKIGMDRRP
jgi:hypothetical protein